MDSELAGEEKKLGAFSAVVAFVLYKYFFPCNKSISCETPI